VLNDEHKAIREQEKRKAKIIIKTASLDNTIRDFFILLAVMGKAESVYLFILHVCIILSFPFFTFFGSNKLARLLST